MNNITKAAIAIAVVAFLAIVYQALVVVPKQAIEAEENQAALDRAQERQEEAAREASYLNCITSAWEVYSAEWDQQCNLNGMTADCSLFPYQYEVVETRYENAQERCVRLHE